MAHDIEFHLEDVNIMIGEQHSEAYALLNPCRTVPTLVDGEVILWEAAAIVRYLSQKHKLATWAPKDLRRRAKMEQYLSWYPLKLHDPIKEFIHLQLWCNLHPKLQDEVVDKSVVLASKKRLMEVLSHVDGLLGQQRFLCSDEEGGFTLADIVVLEEILALQCAGPYGPSIGKNIVRWQGEVKDLFGDQWAEVHTFFTQQMVPIIRASIFGELGFG